MRDVIVEAIWKCGMLFGLLLVLAFPTYATTATENSGTIEKLDQAEALVAARQFKSATELYEQARQDDPYNPECWIREGKYFLDYSGDDTSVITQAYFMLETAARLSPTDSRPPFLIGGILLLFFSERMSPSETEPNTGLNADSFAIFAESSYRRLASVAPKSALPYYCLARAQSHFWMQHGDREKMNEALGNILHALSIDSSYRQARELRIKMCSAPGARPQDADALILEDKMYLERHLSNVMSISEEGKDLANGILNNPDRIREIIANKSPGVVMEAALSLWHSLLKEDNKGDYFVVLSRMGPAAAVISNDVARELEHYWDGMKNNARGIDYSIPAKMLYLLSYIGPDARSAIPIITQYYLEIDDILLNRDAYFALDADMYARSSSNMITTAELALKAIDQTAYQRAKEARDRKQQIRAAEAKERADAEQREAAALRAQPQEKMDAEYITAAKRWDQHDRNFTRATGAAQERAKENLLNGMNSDIVDQELHRVIDPLIEEREKESEKWSQALNRYLRYLDLNGRSRLKSKQVLDKVGLGHLIN